MQEADESLNLDEQILKAAAAIANAVQLLVGAASAAQAELVAQGRLEPGSAYAEDSTWSEGLVSAARMVAAAVHSLCEAANALVLGHASEEKLISAAKQVAASTAHLLVACKVKADLHSKPMQRLQAAGQAVKTATEHLVRAAKASIEVAPPPPLPPLPSPQPHPFPGGGGARPRPGQPDGGRHRPGHGRPGGRSPVYPADPPLMQRGDGRWMCRKEKELEEARVRLAAIRKAKYEAGGPGSHSPSPEHPDRALPAYHQ